MSPEPVAWAVYDGNVTVTMDGTLTGEERKALERAERFARLEGYDNDAATLRGLLERTKGGGG